MSQNTVRKYVCELEERQLIRTEPTTIITRDGRTRNGTLRYHIRPIREAVDCYHEQQLRQLELDVERQRAQTRLSRLYAAQEPSSASGQPAHPLHREAACRACAGRCTRGAKKLQEKALALSLRQGDHFHPQCGRFRGMWADAFPAGLKCDCRFFHQKHREPPLLQDFR